MNDEQTRQLLRELRLLRIGVWAVAAVLVLAAINHVFRFIPR